MPSPLSPGRIAEVRAAIVAVAEHQAVALGLERVSMHGIARALGWSATALYRYFDNKDAILAAARAAAANRLSSRLEAALAGPGDIWARSRAVGQAYIAFARAEPDAYKLLFALSQPASDDYPDLAAATARARANLTRYVERLVAEGGVEADADLLAHVFWAGLHGLVSLEMAGALTAESPAFEAIRHEMVARLLRGGRKLGDGG
ncbi:TetR/AcrR family transcriptional regulator [Sphingomonas morindae]|uniref:TetR/AcrR family transcriptional regulator n=1 Tax=Sphingomonas morindae TaxID=1541170 RepID=A0ABY4XCC7_9SPHN|nr:TetR/AcrR family transcriptional regulator [Sphingomonas morindae]USI74381.1 TetR/AcrR family transcriptional regulator [Sphingomonas morindae]